MITLSIKSNKQMDLINNTDWTLLYSVKKLSLYKGVFCYQSNSVIKQVKGEIVVEMMQTLVQHRIGLVIWLYTPKYVNKLKNFGLLHYVSRKLNYAVLYVDEQEVEKTMNQLQSLHFVREIERSYQTEMPYTYDGLLEELDKQAQAVNKEKEEQSIGLFTRL